MLAKSSNETKLPTQECYFFNCYICTHKLFYLQLCKCLWTACYSHKFTWCTFKWSRQQFHLLVRRERETERGGNLRKIMYQASTITTYCKRRYKRRWREKIKDEQILVKGHNVPQLNEQQLECLDSLNGRILALFPMQRYPCCVRQE